jgi:gamma-glutamyl hercynylcysteine S-oxide synthase
MLTIAEAREQWSPERVYLDTASYGLPPRDGFDALQGALAEWRAGRTSWEHWGESTEGARAAFAQMVGVAPARVAVGATVSEFVGLVGASLPRDARVLVPEVEFTSTLFPFLVQERRGLTVTTVAPARLAEAIDARTDLVAFSAVQMSTGEVADLDAIAAAAQQHGAIVCSAYKWLARGTCFMVVGDALQEAMVPHSAGCYAGEDVHANHFGPPLRLAPDGNIPFLRGDELFEYIAAVRRRALEVLARVGPCDGTLFETVIRHEAQHNETMRQTLFLAGLPSGRPDARGRARAGRRDRHCRGRLRDGRRGGQLRVRQRAPAPRRRAARLQDRPPAGDERQLDALLEGGGYERREWWSDEGWAWKEEYDITHPEGWTAGGPDDDDHRPALHVSWLEADAFARAHGARLPTEAEWAKAATWTQEPLQEIGEAREWTSSHFRAYPGFVAHPYREYSEVFFGDVYRVLRGPPGRGRARVRSITFRNWDLPQRRQIFRRRATRK